MGAYVFGRGSNVLEYWLARAEGFGVRAHGTRIGVVEDVVLDPTRGTASALVLSSRFLHRRRVVLAERGLLGVPGPPAADSPYRSAFGGVFAAVFLVVTAILVWAGDRVAARLAPGSTVAPLLVAFAPFAAAPIAAGPAALLAAPFALLRKVDPT